MSDLRELVFTALDNAVVNQYDLDGYTADEVARDLMACDADIWAAGATADEIAAHVRAWRSPVLILSAEAERGRA